MEILGMILGVICILLLLYLYMICPRIRKKPDREAFMGVPYAHRGFFDNASDAPENSLAAIKKAVSAGYGIEFDVQLTKDEVPVVFHDADLKRMCRAEGKVWDFTYQELSGMRLADSGEPIPTLSEVLEAVGGRVPLIIEYKFDRQSTRVCELAEELLMDYNGPYCIECFHPLALWWYRQRRPEVMRGQLSMNHKRDGRKGLPYWLMTNLLLNFLTRPDFIAYCHQDAQNISRRLCRRLGGLSVAWTIKSPREYRQRKNQFDLFIFDSFIWEDQK